MSSTRRPWLAVVPAALVAGGIAAALVLTSEHEETPVLAVLLGGLVGWSFIAAGLLARTRRPENRTGLLMIGVGFAWFAASLGASDNSVVFTLGVIAGAFFVAPLIHLLLAYPSGRLGSTWERALVLTAYVLAGLGNIVFVFVDPTPVPECEDCPDNAFLVRESETVTDVLTAVIETSAAVVLLAIVGTLVQRWRRSSTPARRLLTPIYLAGATALLLLGLVLGLQSIWPGVADVLDWGAFVAFTATPFLFLWGVLRVRLAGAGVSRALVELPESATPAHLQEALRSVLRDPTVELLFWHAEQDRYVDTEGAPRDPSRPGLGRGATLVESGGRPLGALLHDAALLHERELLERVRSAVRVAIEKDRALFALQTSEQRNRALLAAMPDAMFRLRRDGTFVDYHANTPESLVIPPEGLVGTNIAGVLEPGLVALYMDATDRALESGELQMIEYELDTKQVGHGVRDREARIVASGDDEVVVIVRDITERKRAQLELQRERDFIRTVVNTAPSYFCVVEASGDVVRFNDTLAAASGLADDERVRGRPFWDVFVAPDRAADFRAWFEARVAGAERSAEHESELLPGDGRSLVIEWTCTEVAGAGDAKRYVLAGLDLTDRTRQQYELQRQRDLLSSMADATPSLLVVIGRDGLMAEEPLNRACHELTGYTTEEVGRRSFIELLCVPEDAAEAERVIAATVATGEPHHAETHWLTKSGERRLVAWTCTQLPEIEPGRIFCLITGADVTERVRQQRELERQRDFLSASGDATEALLVVVDGEGRMVNDPINRAGRQLTGYVAEESSFRPFAAFLSTPEDAVETDRVIAAVVATGEPREAETHWMTKSGERRLIAWTCTPLPETEALGRAYLISGVDVTERAAQEEELRRSRARIVEAGDAERRRLERNLHDGAQQRLVSLSLSLRLAQAKLGSDTQQADELLSSASVELALALEELRELARGIHPAVLTERGLGPALESLRDRAPLPVEVECVPDERLPRPVEAAAFYVVAEALTNVTKYAEASMVRVSVERLNGRAVVEVTDDGKGGADPGRGSGLRGLVDRVEALDGQLAIESTPGAGTRIRAEIPYG